MVRARQEVVLLESSDKAFVRTLLLAYVVAPLILGVLAATAFVFPSSEPDTILECQPLLNEDP